MKMVALRKSDFQHPDYRQMALDLIEHATQRTHIITFPTVFLGLLDNQHDAAILLNQILYWCSRTSNPDGWFYKTYADWKQELGLSRYKVLRAMYGDSRSSIVRPTLADLGVQARVGKAPNGNPTVHYRIDMPLFLAQLEYYFKHQTPLLCDNVAEPEAFDASIVNNVAEPNATESPNEMLQCATSSLSIESQAIDNPSKNSSEERDLTLLTPFEKTFGKIEKLSDETQSQLATELQRLGTRTTFDVIERCVTYGKSWYYVLTALKNESSAENYEKHYEQKWADYVSNSAETITREAPAITEDAASDEPKPRRFGNGLPRFMSEPEPVVEVCPTERIHTLIKLHDKEFEAEYVWLMVRDQLQLQLESSYKHYCLPHMVLVDFEPETACFVFAFTKERAREMAIRAERSMTAKLSYMVSPNATVRLLTAEEWVQQGQSANSV
jgi:hypothetical protein